MSAPTSRRNQRRTVRKRASAAALVTNVINGQPMGRLGNLSSGGLLLMLIGPQTPRDEALYQVSVTLPDAGHTRGSAPSIEVGIQEQWHEPAASGQIWAGYRIIAIGEDDVAVLERWLATP